MRPANAGSIRFAVKIRAAKQDEAGLLTELAMRSKAHWGYDATFMARCREELTVTGEKIRLARYDYRVCVEQDRVVGFHALEWLDNDRASLEALFVEPGDIGKGFGKQLISDAKKRARAHGAGEILIEGDPHADGFYRGVGALKIGRRPSGSIAGRWLPLYSLVT